MRDEDKPKGQLKYELSEAHKHTAQLKERVVLNQTIPTLAKRNKRYPFLFESVPLGY